MFDAVLRRRPLLQRAFICLITSLISLEAAMAQATPSIDKSATDSANARLTLARVFGEHMVLQRDQPLRIWGHGPSGQKLRVSLAGQRAEAQVGSDGRWSAELSALTAGGPHVLVVEPLDGPATQALRMADVLIGDVWLCGGQSNMAWPLADSQHGPLEVATSDAPSIRHLRVPNRASLRLEEEIAAAPWVVAAPGATGQFSAVAYHFARYLQQAASAARTAKVPLGLINVAWNGSNLEAWLRPELVLADPDLAPALKAMQSRLGSRSTPPDAVLQANDAPSLGYNGLVHPLLGLKLRGMLWYQGESNVVRAAAYAPAFQRLIADWRTQFGQPDLPFLFVQLAAFQPLANNNLDFSAWAELRDAQRQALRLPNTGMAVATDVGDANDIHPRDKRSVGERLARLALHLADPGQPVASGPVLRQVEQADGAMLLRFDSPQGLAIQPAGGMLQGFALAGANRRFRAASARIEGNTVRVWHEGMAQPLAVRYAWVDNPSQANLVDGLGLPASPFRSDDWPLATSNQRYAP